MIKLTKFLLDGEANNEQADGNESDRSARWTDDEMQE